MTTSIEKQINSLPERNFKQINEILLSTSAAASTIAILPVPILNVSGVVFVQVRMIHKLAKQFGVQEDEIYTKAIVSAVVTSLLSELTSEILESFTISSQIESIIGEKLIRASIAGYLTKIIGEVYIRHFALGGNIDSIYINSFINYTKEYASSDEVSVSNMVNQIMKTTLNKSGISL